MNQTVRILGKVVSLRGETAVIDANGSITVHLNRVCGLCSQIQNWKAGIADYICVNRIVTWRSTMQSR